MYSSTVAASSAETGIKSGCSADLCRRRLASAAPPPTGHPTASGCAERGEVIDRPNGTRARSAKMQTGGGPASRGSRQTRRDDVATPPPMP